MTANTNLYALIVVSSFNHGAFSGSRVAFALFALHNGASAATVGILMALFAVLAMLLAMSAGRLSDRFGSRHPMLAGSIGMIAGFALPALIPGIPVLFVAAPLIGVSFVFFQVATQHAVGELGDPAERPKNFGLLALGFSISGAISPMIAGFTIEHASYTATFLVFAALPLIPLIAIASKAVTLPAPQPVTPGGPKTFAALLRHRPLRRIYLVAGLSAAAWDLNTFLMPIYGSALGISASNIGLILAVFAFATVVIRLVLPFVARRFSELTILSAALCVAGATYLLFPWVTTVVGLMALSFVLGLSVGSSQPLVMALLHQMSPPGRMGEVGGVRLAITNSSSVVVPLLFGAVGASIGIAPVFWAVGICLAAGGMWARRG